MADYRDQKQFAQQLVTALYGNDAEASEKFAGRVSTTMQHLKKLQALRQQSETGATAKWMMETLALLVEKADVPEVRPSQPTPAPVRSFRPVRQERGDRPQPDSRQLPLYKAANYYQLRHPELTFNAALRVVTERVQKRYRNADFTEAEAIQIAIDG